MPTRKNLVGTIREPGLKPRNVDLVVEERPVLTRAEQNAGVQWVDGRYSEGDARRYGFVGDGTTDDTEAIQTGIDVAIQGGGLAIFLHPSLFIPDGEAKITSQLTATSSTTPFRIFGAGRYSTTLKRGSDITNSFIVITLCTDFEICDLGIDCDHTTYGSNGSHGIRLDRCDRAALRRLYITDWTDSGIIHFDSITNTNFHDDILIEDCYLDGQENSNNGILLSNTRNGAIRGCIVRDLGKTGTPCIALQLKTSNIGSKIVDCVAVNALTGVHVGSDEVSFPSNEYCQVSSIIVRDCDKGINVSESRYIKGDDLLLDMDNGGTYAVDIRSSAANCSISNVQILNYYGANQPVRIRAADGNTLHVSHWQNTPDAGTFVSFESDADNNIVIVDNMVGNIPTYTGDLATFESDCQSNSFTIGRSPIVVQATIASGSVTNRNHGAARLVVDTQSAASSDDLDTISAGVFEGNRITVSIANAARNVVLKHETGNLHMKGDADRTLDVLTDIALFEWSAAASRWVEI